MEPKEREGTCFLCNRRFTYSALPEPGTTQHYCYFEDCIQKREQMIEDTKNFTNGGITNPDAIYKGYNHGLDKVIEDKAHWNAEVKKQGVKPVG